MKRPPSLRRRMVLGVVCFTVLITLTTSLLASWFDEQAERHVWETMFRSDIAQQVLRPAEAQRGRPSPPPFLTFGDRFGQPLPAELRQLGPGVHIDVAIGDRMFVVDIERDQQGVAALGIDITDMEQRESKLDLGFLVSGLIAIVILVLITYLGAQWLVRPLMTLSHAVGALVPGTKGQAIALREADPAEVSVIADAFNTYLRSNEGYIERERQFLTMASHELRTPLAVIAGAAEVAMDQPTLDKARLHVRRVLDASRGMQELVVLLLALARDQSRLYADNVPIDAASLLAGIVDDHQHLTTGKELDIRVQVPAGMTLRAPRSLAASVVGNLLRNAIENSHRGTIHMGFDTANRLVIEDPGSAMSPWERSRHEAALARGGSRRGAGIGLDLVRRLCEKMGWQVTLAQAASGGTTVTLDLSATRNEPAG